MKKTILLPLFLGLLLAGCAKTDSKKVSSNDQTDPNKPTYNDQAITAKKDTTDQSQVAATPAPATTPSKEPTVAGQSSEPNSAVATNTTPSTSTTTTPSTSSSSSTTFSSTMNSPTSTPTPATTPPATPDTSNLATNLTPTTPTPASTPETSTTTTEKTTTTTETSTVAAAPATSTTASSDMASNTENNADKSSTESKTDISARITEWKLSPDEIKSEVDSGRVVRWKAAAAGEPTGPMDSVLTTQITSKFQENADTKDLKIDVTADKGVVTLNGSAHTLDQIGKAIALALDTGGVTQAVSQIKLDTNP